LAVVPLPELDRLAHQLAGDRHDPFSERALVRSYEEYLARRRTPLAPIRLRVDGRDYSNFYEFLADPLVTGHSAEIRLDPPPGPGAPWEFLRPFSQMVFAEDGSALVHPIGEGTPERAIVRFLLREHYLPRTEAEEDRGASGGSRVGLPTQSRSLAEAIQACRLSGLIPFSVAVLTYFPEERVPYEMDFVRGLALTDPRAGRLAAQRRVHRTARISWGVDRTVSRGDMPLLATRCLQVLVESHGLTAVEMAHVFGGVRELVDSALQGLAARGFVTFDRRTGVYRPRLDAFLPAPTGGEAAPAPDAGGTSNPALRSSVQELLAAAEARLTCPLCGNPLPPDPKAILCVSCAAEVGAG
jgi:hypothetical protein